VNAGIAAILALRLARRAPVTLSLAANDYGLELLAAHDYPFEDLIDPGLFTAERLAEDAMESAAVSTLARRQFREIARVAGLVFQTYPGARKSGRQLQTSTSLLFDVFSEFDPGNLLLEQARREVLERHFEQSRLARTMRRLAGCSVRVVSTERPTPFSFPLMVERIGANITTENLAARIDRMRGEWAMT
jgi:ATP-dependent Lhr-like helicase